MKFHQKINRQKHTCARAHRQPSAFKIIIINAKIIIFDIKPIIIFNAKSSFLTRTPSHERRKKRSEHL